MADEYYAQTDGAPESHFDEEDDVDYDPNAPLPEPSWQESTWELL